MELRSTRLRLPQRALEDTPFGSTDEVYFCGPTAALLFKIGPYAMS